MYSCTHTHTQIHTHTWSSRINFRENLKKTNMYIYCMYVQLHYFDDHFSHWRKEKHLFFHNLPAWNCKNSCIFLACNQLERSSCKFPHKDLFLLCLHVQMLTHTTSFTGLAKEWLCIRNFTQTNFPLIKKQLSLKLGLSPSLMGTRK